eukprot:gene48463-59350_t
MNVTIVSGKGDKVKRTELALEKGSTVKDLKKAFSKATKKDINRISFKVGDGEKPVRLDDDSKALTEYGVADKAVIQFKDLGAQIGYRTVFLVEYFGPMAFVLLYFLRPSFIYGANVTKDYNWVAQWAVICWVAHFLKRELETLFVHKFSRPTMPLSNLFKNCAYYWLFGAFIGYPLCSPGYVPPSLDWQIYLGLGIFVLSELGNLKCHL